MRFPTPVACAKQTPQSAGDEFHASSARSIKHSSFVIERRFDLRPAAVYRAWTDPEAKARWFNGPADKWSEQVREMDVRVGGRERPDRQIRRRLGVALRSVVLRRGARERLVYTYDMYWQGKKISVSLASVEFVPTAKSKRHQLVVTEQHAFLDGHEDGGSRERGTFSSSKISRLARRRRCTPAK